MTLILFVVFFSSPAYVEENDKRGLIWKDSDEVNKDSFLRGDFRAIVIGNNLYQDKAGVWKNLNTAVSGAEKVASLLGTEYGFSDVILLTNATRKEILTTFRQLSGRVNPNDSILIYYAGHGYLEENDNLGFWVPSDGSALDLSTFLRNSTIRDELNILGEKTQHTLLVSDSCFSGSLLQGGIRAPTAIQSAPDYYRKISHRKSVQVLAAGGDEFVDDNYRDSGQSPFTYFFINELEKNTQRYLSLSEIATNIIKAVANNVRQTPVSGVLHGSGDELGEFVFTRVSVEDNSVEVLVRRNIVQQSNDSVASKNTEKASLANNETGVLIFPAIRF